MLHRRKKDRMTSTSASCVDFRVSNLNLAGADLEVVDIVTYQSPKIEKFSIKIGITFTNIGENSLAMLQKILNQHLALLFYCQSQPAHVVRTTLYEYRFNVLTSF